MTVRITVNRICDRCFRPFDGKQLEEGDKLPEFDRIHYTMIAESVDGATGEVKEKTLIDYRDLCESCTGVVEKAVAKLRMDKPAAPPAEESSKKKEPSRKELAAAVARKAEKQLLEKNGKKEELSTSSAPAEPEPEPEPDPDKSSLLGDPPIPLPDGQPEEAQPDDDMPF